MIDDEEYVDLIINKYSIINQTCEWQIIAKNPTQHVTLAFSHIQLNPALANLYPTEGDCINKGMVVYDGSSDTSPVRSIQILQISSTRYSVKWQRFDIKSSHGPYC